MRITRTENPTWLSNAYLVEDGSGSGVLIDGNDELGPLLDRIEAERIAISHYLLTHVHPDHVAGVEEARARIGRPPLVLHPDAAAELGISADVAVSDGDRLEAGGLEVEAIGTPGHATGHLAFLVDGGDVFTADVLFKGTVGGTMAPGASGIDDLRASVLRLLELPAETRVHPGHREPTTIGAESESNPFVRIWRGLDEPADEPCSVWGREATLKLWAPDYDGGNKAWVRFADSGEEAIVGGSQVERG